MYKGKDTADKLFASMECMESEDIADAVVYVLAAPARVDVNDILIRPTEQAL